MAPRRKRPAQGARRKPPPSDDGELPESSLVGAADAMHRCALESCRQHQRLATLIADGARDEEQKGTQRIVAMCDELLREMTDNYAPVAKAAAANDDIRRTANALWRASRAFANRFLRDADSSDDPGDEHTAEHFIEMRLVSELDASAILSLRHAADEYNAVRSRES